MWAAPGTVSAEMGLRLPPTGSPGAECSWFSCQPTARAVANEASGAPGTAPLPCSGRRPPAPRTQLQTRPNFVEFAGVISPRDLGALRGGSLVWLSCTIMSREERHRRMCVQEEPRTPLSGAPARRTRALSEVIWLTHRGEVGAARRVPTPVASTSDSTIRSQRPSIPSSAQSLIMVLYPSMSGAQSSSVRDSTSAENSASWRFLPLTSSMGTASSAWEAMCQAESFTIDWLTIRRARSSTAATCSRDCFCGLRTPLKGSMSPLSPTAAARRRFDISPEAPELSSRILISFSWIRS
mmetsp:Transcript_15099/g.35980  ORF Transcript_15099/g.35980 Transcript_15099/m.35980 type:complete len:296 (-) Transcript_15099:33-920(-)